MRSQSPSRVLLVADQTADSQELIEAVTRRVAHGLCTFTLLVPARPRRLHRVVDPDERGLAAAEAQLERALPVLSRAAGEEVVGVVGSHDPLAAVQDALKLLGFDEVIISMLPAHASRWLRLDLPRRVRALGLPVTEVVSFSHHLSPTVA